MERLIDGNCLECGGAVAALSDERHDRRLLPPEWHHGNLLGSGRSLYELTIGASKSAWGNPRFGTRQGGECLPSSTSRGESYMLAMLAMATELPLRQRSLYQESRDLDSDTNREHSPLGTPPRSGTRDGTPWTSRRAESGTASKRHEEPAKMLLKTRLSAAARSGSRSRTGLRSVRWRSTPLQKR